VREIPELRSVGWSELSRIPLANAGEMVMGPETARAAFEIPTDLACVPP
jgi:hypothetical protein